MNILVTGGAGFIGSNIVELLVQKGHKVTVYDNLSTGSRDNLQGIIHQFIEGDILDAEKLNDACKNIEVVYHLAASVGRQKSIDFPIQDANTNLIGTINLLEAISMNGVKKIIYSSSAAIYGELLTDVIDENHPINPDSPYGVTKLAAEKMIFAYAGLYGFTAIALRYFNIYGKNQKYDLYGNVIPIFVNRILKDEPIIIYGDGEQTRDFLNVKDVALANFLALECKDSNVFNLGSGSRITINKLAEMIGQTLKITKINYVPKRIGDVLHCKANIGKATQVLHFIPSEELESGLKDYIMWYKATMR